MISDTIAKQLHDRSTRGQKLSIEEQSLLETWYALQDQVENETLSVNRGENHLTALKMQVAEALTQLFTVTKQIQDMTAENEQLKRDLLELRRHLVQTSRLSLAI
jgi:diphthamide synthase subunit DPH2